MRGGVKKWLRVLAPVGASIGGLLLLRLLGPDVMDQRQLHDFIAPMGRAAPFAYLLALALRPLTLLPGSLFTAVGGMVFGTLMGTVYALIGSFLAAVVVFALGRKLGVRPMKRLAGEHYEALTRAASKHDFQFTLLTCINPPAAHGPDAGGGGGLGGALLAVRRGDHGGHPARHVPHGAVRQWAGPGKDDHDPGVRHRAGTLAGAGGLPRPPRVQGDQRRGASSVPPPEPQRPEPPPRPPRLATSRCAARTGCRPPRESGRTVGTAGQSTLASRLRSPRKSSTPWAIAWATLSWYSSVPRRCSSSA